MSLMSFKKGSKLVSSRTDMDIEVIANIMVGAHLRIAYYYFVVKKRKRKKPNIEHITEEFFKFIIKGLQSPVTF